MDQLSTYLPGILLAYSAFLLGILSPGPNVLAVMGTSMSVGRTSGLALAFGVAFGSLTWATLTVLGLSALLAAYASALTAIKIAGGSICCGLPSSRSGQPAPLRTRMLGNLPDAGARHWATWSAATLFR
jgi:hypothetical protein